MVTGRKPYTPDSLAERWRVSAETVRQLCRRGVLAHFRVGRMYRIPADAVDEYEARKV
ncbi:helix-turn-helix domain-containing protein [Roseivivax marinus]|uniref:helix-turn-helix domain-containing protein n=1 Tax=Roseivivax marinus TaxID=1379903 RepID=UPI003517E672